MATRATGSGARRSAVPDESRNGRGHQTRESRNLGESRSDRGESGPVRIESLRLRAAVMERIIPKHDYIEDVTHEDDHNDNDNDNDNDNTH